MALTKIDDRGLKTPIDLSDNEKIRFGTGNDLELYHDGSYSYIDNTHSGGLWIRGGTSTYQIGIQAKNSENSILCTGDGGVELYYDATKVFYTTTAGAIVKRPSGGETQFQITGCEGNAAELRLVADDGDDNEDYWKIKADTVGSGCYIQNFASGSWEESIQSFGNGAVKLFYDNSLKFSTYSGGTNIPDGAAYTAGDSNDVQLYHSGGHGYLSNNTGTYYIRSNVIAIQNNGGDHNYLTIANEAGVSLYYDDVKKLETDSGGVTVSGNVTVSDGNGINFGATSQAGGATSELFADYEEGSFTPTLSGGGTSISYSEQYGYYRKIGKTVFVSVRMQFSCTTNSALFSVGGFPFTAAAAGGANYTSGGITYCNVPLDSADFDPYIGNNVTYMSFYEKVTGNSVVLSSNANNNYIGVGAFFFTDS
jgi:hypothetical protein